MNPMSMSGRTVLVTGASSGIGRETAVLLSQLDARVILAARKVEKLEETRAALCPGRHVVAPIDVSKPDQLPAWIKSLADANGPLDGLVHSAGVRWSVGLRALSMEKLDATMSVNLTSAVMLAKGFRQKGCCTASSSIVLLSSVAALHGAPGISAYAASKAALIGLAKSLAVELAREGIRVNCVAPGVVETSMLDEIRGTLTGEQYDAIVARHPLGIGTPRDVANSIAFLISPASRWITGTVLVADGGYSA